ncbi:MAG: diaminopimelate epimerase [Kiritimatiellaceae bacterium]|nr:diaminopimelate epimerase [Kiritimatiellaceae bacterium]
MMKIPFTKMHGAGNDFIMVDDQELMFPLNDKGFIRRVTARRTGIGCDGILLIQPSAVADFRMRFVNPDGGEQDMCGNGARCIARMAHDLGIAPEKMTIETEAGIVKAEVLKNKICLELTDPTDLKLNVPTGLEWSIDFVNTGVPHAVVWVDDLKTLDLSKVGKQIREHERFAPDGTNVNVAKVETDGSLSIRTYERGVEGETLACGTGATAVALLAAERDRVKLPVTVHCAGGFDLVIDSVPGTTTLTGGAEYVFYGELEYGNRV